MSFLRPGIVKQYKTQNSKPCPKTLFLSDLGLSYIPEKTFEELLQLPQPWPSGTGGLSTAPEGSSCPSGASYQWFYPPGQGTPSLWGYTNVPLTSVSGPGAGQHTAWQQSEAHAPTRLLSRMLPWMPSAAVNETLEITVGMKPVAAQTQT